MIRFFDESDLTAYRESGDPLLELLGDPRAKDLTGERWLRESEAKRAIAWAAYGPLLEGPRLRILDVGAGFSSLSFLMAARHDYLACDLGVHDPAPDGIRVFTDDWALLPAGEFDLVLAVDLFPNVDQRLEAFLARFSGASLRIVLTTYADRWYRAKRTDADEILTVKAWSWEQTRTVLWRRLGLDAYEPSGSLFPNGRQVCLVTN